MCFSRLLVTIARVHLPGSWVQSRWQPNEIETSRWRNLTVNSGYPLLMHVASLGGLYSSVADGPDELEEAQMESHRRADTRTKDLSHMFFDFLLSFFVFHK